MALDVDARARRLLERCRPGRGVLITVVNNYGLPGEMLTVEWCDSPQAERDPDLVRLDVLPGVPVYTYRRLAPFLRWHPLTLTAHRTFLWSTPAIECAGDVWRDMVRWERAHPGLCAHPPAA